MFSEITAERNARSMATPEVSIVITLYREGDLLRESVDSALSQTFDQCEVVLVDNNADPPTQSVAKEFVARYPRSVRLVHETVQGACSARNRGMAESRGRFVAFLDGDDLADPERIALQREAFLSTPGLSLVSGWYDRVSMDNKTAVRKNVSVTEPVIWLETQNILKDLFPVASGSGQGETLHFPLTSTTFFEREMALSSGGFDTRLNPRWFEDIEFYLRMYAKGEFFKIPRSLARYRIATPEMMEVKRRQMDQVGFLLHMDRFYRILWENFGQPSQEVVKIFHKLAALWFRHESLTFLRYREGKEIGVRMLERSLKCDPLSVESWKLRLKAALPHSLSPRLFWFEDFISGPLPPGATRGLVDSIFCLNTLMEKAP